MVLTRVPVAALLSMSGGGSNWEGKASCNLGLVQTECRSIALIVHEELGVMPLKDQQLSYWDVLIEFDSTIDVEWVAQKLLRMGAPCHLECISCSNENALWEFRGWMPPVGCRVDRPIKVRSGNPLSCCGLVLSQKLWGSWVLRGHLEWPEYHSIGGLGTPSLGHL